MLVVVSPAKKLDMSPKAENLETSEPIFSGESISWLKLQQIYRKKICKTL